MFKTKEESGWLSVKEYAKLVGRTVQSVYLDVRLGKVQSRKIKKVVEVLQVKAK